MHGPSALCLGCGQARAQARIGAHATCNRHLCDARVLHRLNQGRHQHVQDGRLNGGADVGPVVLHETRILVLRQFQEVQHLCFQSAETPIVAVHSWTRKRKCIWIALRRQLVHHRASGVRQACQFGHLVEGLAGCIVQRLAQDLHVVWTVHLHQLRVSPTDRQAEKGIRRRWPGLKDMGQDVRTHVMDRNGRNVQSPRHGLGERGADVQGPLQTRAQGVGDGIQIRGGHASLVQSSLHHGLNLGEVCTRSPLGHHAPHLRMQGLVGHDVAQNLRASNHRRRGVVARRLNSQNEWMRCVFHAGQKYDGLFATPIFGDTTAGRRAP